MDTLSDISSAIDTLQIDSTTLNIQAVEVSVPTKTPMLSDMAISDTMLHIRPLSAEDIFGTHSVVGELPAGIENINFSLTSNSIFQSLILIVILAYIILLYRDIGRIWNLFGQISTEQASIQRKSSYSDDNDTNRFLIVTRLLGAVLLSFMAVKYIDIFAMGSQQWLLWKSSAKILSIIFTVAVLCVALYGNILLRIAGSITLTQNFMRQLLHLRLTYFSFWVIITAPAILMFSLCPRDTGQWWMYIIAAETIIALLLYAKNSLLLFISKKIPISHWFLYLCIVEIFPISLLGVIVARC